MITDFGFCGGYCVCDFRGGECCVVGGNCDFGGDGGCVAAGG